MFHEIVAEDTCCCHHLVDTRPVLIVFFCPLARHIAQRGVFLELEQVGTFYRAKSILKLLEQCLHHAIVL